MKFGSDEMLPLTASQQDFETNYPCMYTYIFFYS